VGDDDLIGAAGVRAMLEAAVGQSRCASGVNKLLKDGRRLPDGSRLRLPVRRVGRTWVVSRGDVREFLSRLDREGVLHRPLVGRYPRRKAAAV
jgi:hypothetical protein